MKSEAQSQEKIPDLTVYIQELIEHINEQKQQGEACLEKNNYVGAQAKFDNALNHYTTRISTLSQLAPSVYIPQLSEIKKHPETLQKYHDISTFLTDLLSDIIDKREQNAPQAEQQDREIQRLRDIQLIEKQKTRTEEQLGKYIQELNVLKNAGPCTHTSNTIDEEILEDSIQSAINMSILAGFITALGIISVAIAFATLNLAGLAMPGVALAGFGLVTTVIGCSIFCSTAKNIDEYTDNIYKSFYTSTATA